MQRHVIIVLSILTICFAASLHTETVPVTMRHLTVDDGLSKSAGVSLLQDDQGFMWIGTYDGLNRYDGYQFRVFRPDPDDTTSLSNNYINVIIEGRDKTLWIGTREGLNRYSPFTETFKDIDISRENSGLQITALCQDKTNRIWVGTQDGLCIIDTTLQCSWLFKDIPGFNSEEITLLFCDQSDHIWMGTETGLFRIHPENFQIDSVPFEGYVNGFRVRCMQNETNGTCWVGSDRGLWKLDDVSQTCVRPSESALQHSVVRDVAIYSIVIDDFGALWLGTWGEGVYRYYPEESRLDRIIDGQSAGLPKHVFKIYKDRTGLIWIGSKTGVHLYDPYQKPFITYPIHDGENGNFQWTIAKIIVQDPNNQNILWVSTDQGLMSTDLLTGKSQWIPIDSDNPYLIIHMLFMQPSGLLWVGTNGKLLAYDTKKNKWHRFPELRHPDPRITSMSYYSILWDHQGILWLGTYENGLIRFNPENHTVTFFQHDSQQPNSLPDDHIWALFEDRENRFWIGTDQGLALYDRKTESFATYSNTDSFPLISNKIRVLNQDHEGSLWIGTDGGICRFVANTGEIKCYSEKDGLPNHVIHGILEESQTVGEDRAIWVSTNHGLLRFNPASDSWTAFYKEDGLHGSEFSRKCYNQLLDGRLIFGGMKGWTLFDPSKFITNPNPPAVALTDFELFHESVRIGQPFLGRIFLDQAVSYTSTLQLFHQHDIFGFEFAALHFAHPLKNKTEYYLEGFDPNWIDSRGMRNVTYTNLAPGKYAFHVRAASPDGVWSNKTASIDLVIHPRFWQRWSVRILGVFFIFASALIYYKIRTYQIHKRYALLEELNIQLHQQIQERKKVEKSLRESKKLLTHSLEEKEVLLKEIHHRVKNNLQVVKSLLYLQSTHIVHEKDKAIFKESQDRVQAMALIHEKLYKSDNLAHIDFKDYIQSLVTDLYSVYKVDSYPIDIHLDVQDVHLSIDYAVPCGLIINELVSNAMKHAFSDSSIIKPRIDIILSKNKLGSVLLVVKDNGKGIPENLDIYNTDTLGLDLVKILVERQLHGKLSVARKDGTRFTISFNVT
ncbi:hypothetical protein HQ585_03875 [candidate division KSB1 bacterium]|nr:hypothetical protein [candidate division KSB1 bacterium]